MHRPAVAFLLAFALTVGVPALAQSAAQILGKVVDTDDRPVKGVTIRIEQRGGEFSQEATTRKNGGLAFSRVPPGQYGVRAVGSERFIAKLEFEVKNSSGLTVGQGKMDGHPKQGAGPFVFRGTGDVRLMLMLAHADSEEAYDLVLAFAAPELNALVKLYEKEQYAKVVERTTAILADDSEIGEAHYMQGIAHKRMENHAEAARALDEAAARIPDYPGIWSVLADSRLSLAAGLAETGQTDASREAYRGAADALTRSLEDGPATIGLLIDLAAALDQIDDRDRLVPVLQQVLELEPANLQAKLRLASLHSGRGELDEALALLQAIPDNTEKRAAATIYNVAVELSNAGDLEGSMMAATRAAQIDPDLPQPQQLLVQIHLGRADHPAAAAAIRRYLELAPDAPEAESYRKILGQIETP